VKVRFLSPAQTEVARSALYYLEASPQAAFEFEEEIEEACREIILSPNMYEFDPKSGHRLKLLKKFPFTLYYQIENNDIVIVAAAHHARMPGYWKDRL
jgi:toxin ParE1/3/4